MFQGVGRAHPKEPAVKGGSKILETAQRLFGWGPGRVEDTELAQLGSVSHAGAFVHYPDGSGE